MASVSSSSSVGNTSLRGYGGMVSGIDRDSIIEQMTLGTTTKISNQKKAIQKLQWKQEAFQNISSKLIDIQDNYLSYTAKKNLKSTSTFARNQISVLGNSDVTKYVTASGTSNIADYVSVKGVAQLATASSQKSKVWDTSEIETKDLTEKMKLSTLEGKKLEFCQYTDENGLTNKVSFTFPSTYTENGKTKDIDYTTDDMNTLVKQLNMALSDSSTKFGDTKIGDVFKFELDSNNKIQIVAADAKDNLGNVITDEQGNTTASPKFKEIFETNGYVINPSSSSLKALGYEESGDTSKGVKVSDFNDNVNKKLEDSCIDNSKSKLDYLADKKFTVTYGGQSKTITLLSEADLEELNKNATNGTIQYSDVAATIQSKFDKAFGTGKVTVTGDNTNHTLSFDVADKDKKQALTINSSDSAALKEIFDGKASTKMSTTASLKDNGLVDSNNFKTIKINGVELTDITENSTINDLLNAINENSDIGVKATYLESTNQFVLISTETGSGRKIDLNESANYIFGNADDKDNGFNDGKDAQIIVDYGDGTNELITSSSNTVNLAGMKVTVSNTFGDVEFTVDTVDDSGNKVTVKKAFSELKDTDTIKEIETDTADKVTFKAKADVDGVTEVVKKFIEDYNEMVSAIKTEVTTKPNSDYGPLTDEQKEEMNDTSIENWENKAKEGLLFNNSTMRELKSDLENVMTQLMKAGISYDDLTNIGITYSDDYSEGGKLVFDEEKFKSAMESEPELVSNIFCGGGDVETGLASTVENTLTKYATRYASKNGNSYGRLIEEAGSPKVPLSVSDNEIYRQLKTMNEKLEELKELLQTEQDRYISQFTTMETLINQYNSQASYLTSMSS